MKQSTTRVWRSLSSWIALIFLFSLATATARAAEPIPAKRSFNDSVGLVVKFSQGQSLDTLPMLDDLKVKWVREHVDWSEIESSPGVYGALPAVLRKELAYYRENDIGLVALLTLANSKTAPASAADVALHSNPAAFGRFAAQVARLLKAEGVRFVLEVGNEPHNSFLVNALGGQWNGAAPSPWLDHYVKMVNAAVANVKALDPKVKVLAGDDMWVVDYWLLAAGLDPRLDGLTVHPYTSVPEIAAVANDTDWVRPFVAVDPDRSFQSGIERLRAAALKKQGRPVEIWITEMGWPTIEQANPPTGAVSERAVAAYLPRSFMLAAESGVEGICWFSSQDAPDGPMGLTRNDWSRRLAYDAFKTMTSQIGKLRFSKRLFGERGTAATVQALLFTDDQTHVVVAWQATGTEMELVVPQAIANEIVMTDFLGARKTLRAKNGQFVLPLNGEPVYLKIPVASTSMIDDAVARFKNEMKPM